MTSPLVVTLGLSLTIPLALLGDVVGYGRVLGLGYWIGASLVLAGFFGVNGVTLSERQQQQQQEEDRYKEFEDDGSNNQNAPLTRSLSSTPIAEEQQSLLSTAVSIS